MIIYVPASATMSAQTLNIKAKTLYAWIEKHAVTRPGVKNFQGDEADGAV